MSRWKTLSIPTWLIFCVLSWEISFFTTPFPPRKWGGRGNWSHLTQSSFQNLKLEGSRIWKEDQKPPSQRFVDAWMKVKERVWQDEILKFVLSGISKSLNKRKTCVSKIHRSIFVGSQDSILLVDVSQGVRASYACYVAAASMDFLLRSTSSREARCFGGGGGGSCNLPPKGRWKTTVYECILSLSVFDMYLII